MVEATIVEDDPEVQHANPPAEFFPDIAAELERSKALLGDADMALLAAASRNGGKHLALIIKDAKGWSLDTWVSQAPGERVDAGIRVLKTWKFGG